MLNLFKRLITDEEGQGMVEYALIIALVSLAAYAMLQATGTNLSNIFTNIKNKLSGY